MRTFCWPAFIVNCKQTRYSRDFTII